MKQLFMMVIIIIWAFTASAQTYYVNNYWTNGNKKIAYVTLVYAYTNSAVAKNSGWSTYHYGSDLKKAFHFHLENNGVENVANYSLNTFISSEDKNYVESERQLFIDRLKRDGYTVNISDFTWKPQD